MAAIVEISNLFVFYSSILNPMVNLLQLWHGQVEFLYSGLFGDDVDGDIRIAS